MITVKVGPKPKISREMVLDAAFEVAREQGADKIFARTVAEKLSCSTQPVMFHFKTIEELKRAVYKKVDAFHAEYVMNITSDEPLRDFGLNFIRFAAKEKNLFKFLFQSNGIGKISVTELLEGAEFEPILKILADGAEIDLGGARNVFKSLFLFVLGYASMLGNNSMIFDEEQIKRDLDMLFKGAVYAVKNDI